MELAFTTFYYSSHLGLVGALESVANYQDFLGLKLLIFFTLLLLLFFSNYLLIESSRSKRKRSVYPLLVLRFLFDIFMFFSIFMDFIIIL